MNKAADTLREVERDVVCQCNFPPLAMHRLNGFIECLNQTAVDLDLNFGLVGDSSVLRESVKATI
jgi:hypothetical protein